MSYERMPPIAYPLFAVVPVLWHCGELCGIDHIEIVTPMGDVIEWPARVLRGA